MLNSSNHFAILAIFSACAFPFLRRRYVSTVGFRSAFCAKYLNIVGSLNRGSVLLTIVAVWISSDVVISVHSGIYCKSSLALLTIGLAYIHRLLEKCCSLLLRVLVLYLRLECCWRVVCSCEAKFLIQLIDSVCWNWC
jgi:hypothetical protein